MRNINPEYAFNKAELQILRELTKEKLSLPEIKKSLSLKPALLSYNLKKLQKKGLIQTSKQGNRKYACFSETKHASLLRDLLISHDFMDWENILPGKTIDILFQALTNKEDSLSSFSNVTLWRYLKELKARGIITESQKKYQINPRFPVLIDFLNEYQRYFANKISKTLSENSVILWQKDMEFLVRVPKTAKPPSKDLHKTASSIFPQYGLPFFSEFEIYLYSAKKKIIKPEDALLHTLLLEPDNVRYTTYALLLLKKTEKQIDKTYLLQESEKLGLKNQIISMLQFLETHLRPQGQSFPTWEEFAIKAEDYGVNTK
jgi:DNA-binding PadR family transcriptional regulator